VFSFTINSKQSDTTSESNDIILAEGWTPLLVRN